MNDEYGKIPVHLAIIMDGNGRWAKSRGLPRSVGHRNGMNTMVRLCSHAFDKGVKIVTVYALSTENLSRPKDELESLFDLFRTYFTKGIKSLFRNNIRFIALGDISALPEDIVELIKKAETESAPLTAGTLNIAVNYGSRTEIISAVNKAVENGKKLNEEDFSALLYTGGDPDPDLIIRTGGEKRLSNFLLWQSAYSELYFSDVFFPDFDERELDKALDDYARRNRRYGKTQEQIEQEK